MFSRPQPSKATMKSNLTLKSIIFNALIFTVLCLPAFSWSQSVFDSDTRRADTYRRSDAMAEGTVETCKVLATRQVTMEVGNTAKIAGTTAGSVIGGALAARNTNSNSAAVLGALLGGLAGNAVVQRTNADIAHELILNCNGRAITVVQEVDGSPVPSRGSEVNLIRLGGRSRVVI